MSSFHRRRRPVASEASVVMQRMQSANEYAHQQQHRSGSSSSCSGIQQQQRPLDRTAQLKTQPLEQRHSRRRQLCETILRVCSPIDYNNNDCENSNNNSNNSKVNNKNIDAACDTTKSTEPNRLRNSNQQEDADTRNGVTPTSEAANLATTTTVRVRQQRRATSKAATHRHRRRPTSRRPSKTNCSRAARSPMAHHHAVPHPISESSSLASGWIE